MLLEKLASPKAYSEQVHLGKNLVSGAPAASPRRVFFIPPPDGLLFCWERGQAGQEGSGFSLAKARPLF